MKFVAVLLAATLAGCGASPAQVSSVVTEIIDVVDAVCAVAEQQSDPAWIYYVCTVAGAPPGTATQYTVKVPPDQSAAFAAAHAGKRP
jgi:hypothetical protein